MKQQFETREELVQDAINYYWGKPERQCFVKGSTTMCSYLPSETSEGCAIGRLVELEVAKKLEKENKALDEDSFNLLPQWLKKMGQGFLMNIQMIHDEKILANKNKETVIENLENYVDFDLIKFPED
jgi:hypothetical protein